MLTPEQIDRLVEGRDADPFATLGVHPADPDSGKTGFTACVLPKVCLDKMKPVKGLRMIGVSNVREAIGLL